MRQIRVAVSLLVLALAVTRAPLVEARNHHIHIDDFLAGLACIESGGRFDAFNAHSGSYGKYQFMPRNWVAWSERYMGNPWAEKTPRNQEFVARQRVADLYDKHNSWREVAHWWLTGNAGIDEKFWSHGSTKYVNRVVTVAAMAASPRFADAVPERCRPVDYRDPKIRTEPFPRVHVSGLRVNIRAAAGYESRSVGYVRRGARLSVLDDGKDARGKAWLKVGLPRGRTGWIARWFTR